MIKQLRYLCTLLLIAVASAAWGDDVLVYTLDGTQTGGSNGYATESEITQNDITWMVMGNTTMNPWRIGGKNLTNEDRPLYSTSTIGDNISRVVVTNGTVNSGLTVNSISLVVSSNADFSNATNVEGVFAANSTTTFERPTGADWTNKYFKIVYNVTAGSSNTYVQFIKADFYMATSNPTCGAPVFSPVAGTYTSAQNVTISTTTEGASIYYTLDGSEPSATNGKLYSDPIIVSTTTTIKAIAVKGDYNNSTVESATYTIVSIEHAGTESDPYTVADARAAIDAGIGITDVYATGIVSAIPTAYSSQYSNITFNFVDEEGNTEFLQAYRCVGDEAANVQIGDIVVVYGNLKKYNSTYEFDTACKLVSLKHQTVAVEAPTFNPVAGTYADAQTVSISCETDGATIYYTTDGTDPSDASTVFTDAISVTTTTTIKAIAIKGGEKSAVVTATYHINSQANPYTVAQALAFNEYPANGIYVHGIVSTAPTQAPTDAGQLTYYISDNGEATDQLQVYKGKGLGQAAFTAQNDIQVGDIVTIYGNVKIYNSTKEFDTNNYLVSFERSTTPIIKAEDVTINHDITSGVIEYQIEYPVAGTTLSVAVDGDCDWLSLGNPVDNTIPFTCSVNEGEEDRTVIVKLTYGYVSKEVTVTQKHLVVDYATLPFAYDGNGSGKLPLGLTQNGVGTYNTSPAMKFDGTGDWLILKFNEQPGKLTFDIKGNSFSDGTFKVQTSEDGLTYTDLKTYTVLGNTQNEEFNNLGENVRFIKWIYTEKVNGNVALGNINLVKPGQVLSPVISANNVTISANATSGEISYSIANPVDDVELTATTDVDWISNIVVSAEKITFSTTANTGDADRIATFILKYEGAESKEVTVTQRHVVADVAELPFEFDGGKADIANTAGLTHEGLDSDYGSSPKLKFNSTGDYLLLHFNEQPGKLTYAIKGNSFSGGTFKVQTSADGESFTDLGTYTALDETTQSEEFINLSADARYIKWIYTEKVSGNVALGLIKLEKPSNDPIITAEDVTIEANATSGEIAYTITNSIEGTTLSASTDTEWISDVVVAANKVSFTTTENTGAERTGVIKLTYGPVTKEVTVKQKRSVISGNVRYELVNSTDGLTDGQYLIVSSLDEFAVAFDGSLETLDAVGNNKLVTVTDNVIMASDDISFTINVTDGTIKSASGYYIGVSSNSNGLKQTDEAETYKNAFDIDEDGNAAITAVFEGSTMSLRYNKASGQDRFRYFKDDANGNPTQEAIQLFKKVSSTETLLGDVNGDEKVDIADVTKLVNLLLNESESHNPADHPAANLDGDEDLDADDVRALVEKVLSEE